jgi:hypothetical protein
MLADVWQANTKARPHGPGLVLRIDGARVVC